MNRDDFVYPSPVIIDGDRVMGLTKRELFAAMAMQGYIANKERPQHFLPHDDAAWCVRLADELIKALAK